MLNGCGKASATGFGSYLGTDVFDLLSLLLFSKTAFRVGAACNSSDLDRLEGANSSS